MHMSRNKQTKQKKKKKKKEKAQTSGNKFSHDIVVSFLERL